ncbi:MAG: hypothetical protein WC683_06765 [bacterium]
MKKRTLAVVLVFSALVLAIILVLMASGCKTLQQNATSPGGTPASQSVSDAALRVDAEGDNVKIVGNTLRAEVPAITSAVPYSGGVVAAQADVLDSISARLLSLSGEVKALSGQVATLEQSVTDAAKTIAKLNAEIVKLKAASESKTATMLRWLLVLSIAVIAGGIAATIWLQAFVGKYGLAASTMGAIAACVSWVFLSKAGTWLGYAVATVLLAAVVYVVIIIVKRAKAGLASATGLAEEALDSLPLAVANELKIAANKEQQKSGTLAVVAESRKKEVKVL